jgi:hypothetical protein
MIPAAGAECACSLFFAFNTRDIKEQARKLHEFSSRLLFPSHMNGPDQDLSTGTLSGIACVSGQQRFGCSPLEIASELKYGQIVGSRNFAEHSIYTVIIGAVGKIVHHDDGGIGAAHCGLHHTGNAKAAVDEVCVCQRKIGIGPRSGVIIVP